MSSSGVRLATPGDAQAVARLLLAGFGDEDGFIAAFFRRIWQKHAVTLSFDGDVAVSMAALFGCDMDDGAGHIPPAVYLYALTTLPEFRARGHAGALLRDAAARADTVFLHAADAGLQAMYARLGWRYGMAARRTAVCRGDIAGGVPALVPADEKSYFAARERLLRGTPHIVWGAELLGFHRDLQARLKGGLLLGDNAAAAVSMQADGIFIQEALGENAAQGALNTLHIPRAALFTPCPRAEQGAEPLCQFIGLPPPEACRMTLDFN